MIVLSTIANTTGTHPEVEALNATSADAIDGTPYLKSVIDNWWGADQALMWAAGLTPDGVTESYLASQRLQALYNVLIGPGCIVAWAGNNADPNTDGRRMIQLNGQGILVASYTDLDNIVYVGGTANPTASSFYHADDAAGTIRNIAGIYLILPDFRGQAIRGLDLAAAVDPDGAGRDIGHLQNWALKKHEHYVWDPTETDSPRFVDADQLLSVDFFLWDAADDPDGSSSDLMAADIPIASVPDINQSNDESRMSNAAARWVITY